MSEVKRCPSLGLKDDQTTCRTFANDDHYCYHQAKSWAVPEGHQKEYCLSGNHIRCPIFLTGKRMYPQKSISKPSETLIIQDSTRRSSKLSMSQSISVFTVLAMLVFTTWLVFARTGSFALPEPTPQSSQDLSNEITATITPTVNLFTPNPTLINELTLQAIKTSLMSRTPTITNILLNNQTPTRILRVTQKPTVFVCVKPDGWIVYKVKFWDTLDWFSLWVRTPVEELMEANCLTTKKLVVGQELFLPYYPRIATFTPSPSPTKDYVAPGYTRTFTLTFTRTLARTITPSRTPTKNPLFFDTRTPTSTSTITPIPSSTYILTPTTTFTNSPTATRTSTRTPTPIIVPSNTFTFTPTATNTPEPTPTDTPEPTPTDTPEPTPTDTSEPTPMNTPE